MQQANETIRQNSSENLFMPIFSGIIFGLSLKVFFYQIWNQINFSMHCEKGMLPKIFIVECVVIVYSLNPQDNFIIIATF